MNIAIPQLIPRHVRQQLAHHANVRRAGKGEPCPHECGQQNPRLAYKQREYDSDENQNSGPEPYLTLKRPISSKGCYQRQASRAPRARSPFQNKDPSATLVQHPLGDAGTRSRLANKDEITIT